MGRKKKKQPIFTPQPISTSPNNGGQISKAITTTPASYNSDAKTVFAKLPVSKPTKTSLAALPIKTMPIKPTVKVGTQEVLKKNTAKVAESLSTSIVSKKCAKKPKATSRLLSSFFPAELLATESNPKKEQGTMGTIKVAPLKTATLEAKKGSLPTKVDATALPDAMEQGILSEINKTTTHVTPSTKKTTVATNDNDDSVLVNGRDSDDIMHGVPIKERTSYYFALFDNNFGSMNLEQRVTTLSRELKALTKPISPKSYGIRQQKEAAELLGGKEFECNDRAVTK